MKDRKERTDSLSKPRKKKSQREPKRAYQVNVHFDAAWYRRLQAAASIQHHSQGQLCRILIEWALPFYEKSESVKGLKAISNPKFLKELEVLGRAAAVGNFNPALTQAEQLKERSA